MSGNFIESYFGFNRQQRNGLLVLMCISFLLLLIRITYPYLMAPGTVQISMLPLAADSTHSETIGAAPALFYFDPNTASAEELRELGFTENSAETLIRFRKKFTFRHKKDLLKVYGISPDLYEELAPYVRFTTVKRKGQYSPVPETKQILTKQQTAPVELNRADSLALLKVPGIGPVFASRIIKYRNLLGGFVSKEQLKEVYGLSAEKYEELHDFFTADSTMVQRININTADFKTLNRHPYIAYEQTKAIFNTRRKSALTESTVKAVLSDEALYNKVSHYLSY